MTDEQQGFVRIPCPHCFLPQTFLWDGGRLPYGQEQPCTGCGWTMKLASRSGRGCYGFAIVAGVPR